MEAATRGLLHKISTIRSMVYSQIDHKTREFNLPMIMLNNMELMIIMIKLSIMGCTYNALSRIFYFSERKLDIDFLNEFVTINDSDVYQNIYKFKIDSLAFNKNTCNIGIITVEGHVNNEKKKPKYKFVVLGSVYPECKWLIIVNYNGNTSKPGKLGILCNISEEHDNLFFKTDQVNTMLRKYKLKPEYWQPDDQPAKFKPLVERKTSISNPLKAGKISRLKHAVGKIAHKAAKNVKRLFGKTVSLSKSKGTFTRIRVEPEKNAKEVMARIKERFGEGNPGKKGSPKENVTQPSKTNWDKFLKQIKLESQQEKAVRQYETLKRKNISGTNL